MESYDIYIVVLFAVALGLKYGPEYLKSGTPSSPASTLTECIEASETESRPLINGQSGAITAKLRAFGQFQRWYIVIFLLVMLADWMQGPYGMSYLT